MMEQSSLQDVLRNLNTAIFNEIHPWVCESFNTISSLGTLSFPEAIRSFPVVKDAVSRQLFTGLVLTKNIEFVDDLVTFEELGLHLKSQGCHVANLSALDFSVKNDIGGCLRSVLSERILKIPVILIMGVATTLDALRNVLPSNTLHHLCPCKFILGSPSERIDAVVESVLVKHCSGFSVSHKVSAFMRNYFVSQDVTITSFIRALKMACAQHFSMEFLSFVLLWFLLEEDSQVIDDEKYGLSPEMMLKHALDRPSCTRNKGAEQIGITLVNGLSELKKLQRQWSTVVMCLYEAGKCDKIQPLDLFCEALDPEPDILRAAETHKGLQNDSSISSRNQNIHKTYPSSWKGGFVCQAIHKVRDLSAVQLCKLPKGWEKHVVDVPQSVVLQGSDGATDHRAYSYARQKMP